MRPKSASEDECLVSQSQRVKEMLNTTEVAGGEWSSAHTTKLGNNLESISLTHQIHLSSQTVKSVYKSIYCAPIYCTPLKDNKQGIDHLSVSSTHCGAGIWRTPKIMRKKMKLYFFQISRIRFSIEMYIWLSHKQRPRKLK